MPAQKKTREENAPSDLDGVFVDLASFDWGDAKLTDKEKLFCFWLAHPATRGNASLAARKAGYSQKSSPLLGSRLRSKDKLKPVIKRLEDSFLKTSVEDAYRKILQKQINRALVDRTGLFSYEFLTNDSGAQYLKITPKPPEELTSEQRDCIEGVEFSGVYGTANYKLASSERAEKEIIRIYEKTNGIGESDSAFDVETVVDVIRGNLQVKTKLINANREIAAHSDLRNDASEDRAEED